MSTEPKVKDWLETTEQVFPLRLTSMEQFHYYDDQPAYPNIYFARFRIAGPFDAHQWEQALRFASQVHPMVHVVLDQKGSGLWWKLADDVSPLVDLTRSDNQLRVQPFDLTREVGYRCYMNRIQSEDGRELTQLLFQGHHSVGDGAAALQFTATAFQAYDNLVNQREIDFKIRRPKIELLKSRGKLGLTEWRYLKHLWKIPIGMFGATKFIFRRHAGLALSDRQVEWDGQPPTLLGTWMERDKLAKWREKAKQLKVTLNTVLLGELYKTIHQWNDEHQPHAKDQWMRIVLPINIRSVSDRWLPGVNKTSVVQIDRRADQFAHETGFLQGLHREIGIIRKWHLDKIFLIAVRTMSLFPAWMRSSARNQKCRGAALWTNLGEPFAILRKMMSNGRIRLGNAELVEMDLCGPVRYLSPVNFSVYELDKRLRLCLRIDPRQMEMEHAHRLFEIWQERLGV